MKQFSLILVILIGISLSAQEANKKDCRKPGVKSPINFEKVSVSEKIEESVRKLMKDNKKIEAVRIIRAECKDLSLQEAKELVESVK